MIRNAEGDMGFLEAMLAMMAVVLALTAFIGAAALLISADADTDLRFDLDKLGGEVVGDEFEPSYEDYLQEYLDVTGRVYVSVEAEVPGFCAKITTSAGKDPGSGYATLFRTATVSGDGERVLPAVFRVIAC
ncbi:MAG: hypothetical protein J5812_04890 [Candidatus Methanomethylophilaceae archaeon]|nr:hypothetical protein [Candidatus Methanomethylophilaceae archaeon]